MIFRQEADEVEVWYTETDDPDEPLKMKKFNKLTSLRELQWWLDSVKNDGNPDAKIHMIREAF